MTEEAEGKWEGRRLIAGGDHKKYEEQHEEIEDQDLNQIHPSYTRKKYFYHVVCVLLLMFRWKSYNELECVSERT